MERRDSWRNGEDLWFGSDGATKHLRFCPYHREHYSHPFLHHFEECGEVKADLHYSTGNRQSISWHLLYGWNVRTAMMKKKVPRIVEWRWAIKWIVWTNIIQTDSCCCTHFFQAISFGDEAGILAWLYSTITHTSSLTHSRNCVEEAESGGKANTTVHMERRHISPFQNPRNSYVNSRRNSFKSLSYELRTAARGTMINAVLCD